MGSALITVIKITEFIMSAIQNNTKNIILPYSVKDKIEYLLVDRQGKVLEVPTCRI